jgi:hypothetical protein
MTLPRFVSIKGDSFVWDDKKLQVPETHRNDKYMLQNIFHGYIVRGDYYPLIYEHKEGLTRFRSIEFYKEVLRTPDSYEKLFPQNRHSCHLGLRDLYYASIQGYLDSHENDLLNNMSKKVDDDPILMIDGYNVSFYPSKNYKVVKFVSTDNMDISEAQKQYFIIKNNPTKEPIGRHKLPSSYGYVKDMPTIEHIMVFVDPCEQSYHNFENILHLNSSFSSVNNITKDKTEKIEGLDNSWIYQIHSKSLVEAINNIDQLDMYVPPLNSDSRGGKRLIFKSPLLAHELKKIIPEPIVQKVRRVNDVFRLNKFKPLDDRFSSHLDTPYYDKANKEVSLYTLLVYFNGGTSSEENPLLRIETHDITSIEPLTVIIFPQEYEHEGHPFLDGTKLFIRTELICSLPKHKIVPEIGHTFAKACYLTKESIFNEELKSHASQYFDRVARLHWNLSVDEIKEVMILKTYNDSCRNIKTSYFTNGCDYWFPNGDLRYHALIVILDYFNVKINDKPFNTFCQHKVMPELFTGTWDMGSTLLDMLCQVSSTSNDMVFAKRIEDDYDLSEEENSCCPYHSDDFDPTLCGDTLSSWAGNAKIIDEIINDNTFAIFGSDIYFDPNNVLVDDIKIQFKTRDFPRVNFAACWNCEQYAEDYVRKGPKGSIYSVDCPPIIYHKIKNGYHLQIDAFQNNFCISSSTHYKPILEDISFGRRFSENFTDSSDESDGSDSDTSVNSDDEDTYKTSVKGIVYNNSDTDDE